MFVFLFYLVFSIFHPFLISFPHFLCILVLFLAFLLAIFSLSSTTFDFSSVTFSLSSIVLLLTFPIPILSVCLYYLPFLIFNIIFIICCRFSWLSHRFASFVCAAEISMGDVACLGKKATLVKKFWNGIKMFFNNSCSMNGPLLTPGGASSPMGKIAFLQ